MRERRMVGASGFEPPTPRSRTECSTRLSHAPTKAKGYSSTPTEVAVRFPTAPVTLALLLAASAPAFAQVGTRPAKEWIPTLERPERIAGLKIDEVLPKLGVKSGDIVADLGAGTGVFSWPIARLVAPGMVYAVEVDEQFV